MIKVNEQGFLVNEHEQFVDTEGNVTAVPVKAATVNEPKQSEQEVADEQLNEKIAVAVAKALAGQPKQQTGFGLKDLSAAIADAVANANAGQRRVVGRLPVREEELEADDYLSEPVVFYAYSQTWWIFDDVRKGQAVLPPYGKPIKFHNFVRTKKSTATGKYDGGVIAICRASIRSKKQVEWLKNHSLFNIRFFETVESAQNVTVMFAEKLKEADNQVGRVEYEIIEKAKAMGIPLTTNIATLRSQVVFALAQVFIGLEQKRAYVPEVDFSKQEKTQQLLKTAPKQAANANY